MPESLTLGILITNYNTWESTIYSVEKIIQLFGENFHEIVIVDDFSDAKLNHVFNNKVSVYYNERNLGYASSVNRGFGLMKSDVVLLLDSDASPLSDITGEIMTQFLNNDKLGSLGFRLVDRNGNNTGCWERESNFWSLILGQKAYEWLYMLLNNNKNFVVYSCAIAIRKKCFVELGGFDEGFDFLDADADFSMRINRSDWVLKRTDSLTLLHEGGGSPQKTSKRVLRYYVNRYRLFVKHDLIPNVFLIKWLTLARLLLECLILFVFGRFVYTQIIFDDKLKGRRDVIRYVNNTY